jgi:hypothetical protein
MLVLLTVSYVFDYPLPPAPFPPHRHRHGIKEDDVKDRLDYEAANSQLPPASMSAYPPRAVQIQTQSPANM